ncbi:MAG: penicillin-binding transpeptidase domain-containing protein [Candidatus Krumholzibacteria bacterium]|nr:penicillin-binding transpeptidase domain-containing protein [Candidatus Krumholzibacteria bacterium]
MKSWKNNLRLYVVGGIFVLFTFVLWARLIQVQVFGQAHYGNIAENQWKVTRQIPPVRGGIFDRNGRPLALSIRSCSVSLRPQEVKEPARVISLLSKRLSISKRSIKKYLRSDKPFVWVKRQCSLSEKSRLELKSIPGVDIHWEADRVYPFGSTGAKIVGFVGRDSKGMAGIEATFDETLAGEPGWEKVQRDGAYRSRGYYTYAQRKPKDGRHVFLTIDASIQEIAELELERATEQMGAKGGTLIVLDCKSGEILSLAEYPAPTSRENEDLVDSLWTIRSISHAYEPGSTFKLVTAAALLETSKIRSFDVFDAENGKADLGVAVISDAHPHGHLTFREGFVLSSNIVMAKASLNLDPMEFFKFIRVFGFGAKTGVQFPGESAGRVAPVSEWSRRTQVTMAFGQEIAVTPLQMANAFAAVANDGVLMVPRIVKSVVDENRGTVKAFDAVKVRRIVSEDTARRLKSFCQAVVEEGTGTKAALDYLRLSGKTGTAEKASVQGGYSSNRFIASFIGFAPYDDPQIVCLVSLDEPSYYYRFGGVSAAPVFARMMAAIANSSSIFDEVLLSDFLEDDPMAAAGTHIAPNFLRLDRDRAMQRARQLELNVLCKGEGGEVVAQDPDPGVAMARDEVIRLYMSGNGSSSVSETPDLVGLPLRVAKRRAVEAGLRCRVTGSGVVTSQYPPPKHSAKGGVVKIYCENKLVAGFKS